jgi:hypothetical protein
MLRAEISRLVANSPELAGIRARILSLQAIGRTSGVVSAHLSLPRKIAFPDSRDGFWPRLGPPKILSEPSHGRRCAVPADSPRATLQRSVRLLGGHNETPARRCLPD